MNQFTEYCCYDCHKPYLHKHYQRHIRSSYHLTYTSDKLEKQRFHKSEKRKEYYITNKEKDCKKYECKCGGKYTHANKTNHINTILHKEYEKYLISVI